MQVQRILETCLYVDDLGAAETFYNQVLGLQVLARVEGRHVFFRCEDSVVLIFNPTQTEKVQPGSNVPPHGAHGSGHVAFAIQQADIPAWREHLGQNGVAIEAEVTWPSGGRSIYFRDPAGNSLELATPQTWELQ